MQINNYINAFKNQGFQHKSGDKNKTKGKKLKTHYVKCEFKTINKLFFLPKIMHFLMKRSSSNDNQIAMSILSDYVL